MTYPSGPSEYVGSRLLFENDRVRVWELVLEPGQSSGWHIHKLDYMVIPVAAGEFRLRRADGTEVPEVTRRGEVLFFEGEHTEELVNVGATKSHDYPVELK